ncbi:hypothetical protein BG015_004686 [Linnemannia schmuckeri]|uniref:Uncharacterized protein n=1 Tax=Linnemannia schmuckeri TaxID=64567 RepID=A0A9P5VCX1_9FUNG|nr:hypothetical protein BG015_004686 [Linnemannia schmuckeri]
MGEHHSDTTNDAALPSAAVSLNKSTSDDDLASYIGASLSPSFKAKVMISDNNNHNSVEDCDVDMATEGVELEVASLAVQSVETELLQGQASPLVDMATTTPSTTTTASLTPQTEQNELKKGANGNTEAITLPLDQNESTNQEVEEDEGNDDRSNDEGDDNDDAQGLDEEPSMIVTTDAIYSAVPISSELHIFPHSSKGFNWNQDHFLKPHQRRNLGVDELHSAFNASIGGIVRSESSTSSSSTGTSSSSTGTSSSRSNSNTGGGMSAIRVHEIHLDQEETDQILPHHS